MSGRWYQGYCDSFSSYQYHDLKEDDYEIFLQINSIQKYLQKIITIQSQKRRFYFFPTYRSRINNYFKHLSVSFNPEALKYSSNTNLEKVSNIIANIGKSGYNYINSVENVIELNKPVLLFYGIEHLVAFYLNLHLNFTEENQNLWTQNRKKLIGHGVDPFNFNDIPSEFELDDLLNYKIKLLDIGLCPRFFLVCKSPLECYFLKSKKLSLMTLLRFFFTNLRIGISERILAMFFDEFGRTSSVSEIKKLDDLDLFVFYLFSFLFSHLARYKINAWNNLLLEDKKNFGFIIRFIMKTIRKLFIRRIFSLIYSNNEFLSIRKRKLMNRLEKTNWYCPNCSQRLYKTRGIVTASLPPKAFVRCLNCDYTGYETINPNNFHV